MEQICKKCGIMVKDIGKHLRRKRCKEQHNRRTTLLEKATGNRK